MEKCDLNISDYQKELLKQFKQNVFDILVPNHTDVILLRFLRAKNFNLKTAEMNFRQADCNRKMFGVNNILDYYKKPEVAEKYESQGFLGFAKDGTPIRYLSVGGTDLKGLIMSMSGYELCLYFSHFVEQDIAHQREESQKRGEEIDQTTYIFDFETFRIQQVAHKSVMEMGLDSARLVQDFYPELSANIFIVNPPFAFNTAFNLFKPIMKISLLDKMHVISKNSTGEYLLKYIDEDVLPTFLGGKRVDSNGDPMCTEFIKFGGVVPEDAYACNRTPLITPMDPGVTTLTVSPRSVHNHILISKKDGLKIRMAYRTENGSIYFSLLYRAFGADPNIPDIPGETEILDEYDEKSRVIPISANLRPQTHLVTLDGVASLLWPGIYIFRFCNTDSWFGSRKLIYKFEILE